MDLRIEIVITQADVATEEAFAKTERVLKRIRELGDEATTGGVVVFDRPAESGSEAPYPGSIPMPGEQSPGWR